MVPFGALIFVAIGLTSVVSGLVFLIPHGLQPAVRWRWWALAIAAVGAAYAGSIAVQQSVGPTVVNVVADRVQVVTLLLLIPMLIGLTYSYWDVGLQRTTMIATVIHGVVAIYVLVTDTVVIAEFSRRAALPFVDATYWEADAGPLQTAISIYLIVASVGAIIVWLRFREPDRRGSGLFMVGYSVWLALGLVDAATNAIGLPLPPLMAVGFLIFVALLAFMSFEDIRSMESELEAVRRRYRSLAENSSDVIILLNGQMQPVYVSPSVEKTVGYSPEEVRRKALSAFVAEEDREDLERRIDADRRARTASATYEYRIIDAHGSIVWLESRVTYRWVTAGVLSEVIIQARDVTRRKDAEAQLRAALTDKEYLATHDSLTGLRNRAAMRDALIDMLARAQRKRPMTRFAVMFTDLNRFKAINDTLGHAFGDELLIQVAKRLVDSVRESDLCFRIGGDEFVVVVDDVTEDYDAATVAGKIIQSVSQPYEIAGKPVETSISVGIALFPQDGDTVEELQKHADIAMYAAKVGRTGFYFYGALDDAERSHPRGRR